MATNYKQGVILGTGTYGDVFEAYRKTDNIRVAIKRIKPDIDGGSFSGVNFTALREMKSLKEISHENVVCLLDVFISVRVIHLVLEFCSYDLLKIIQDKSIFITSEHVKSYMLMILRGLNAIHEKFILHRDLKPANLLFSSIDGQIKLADFGLARSFGSPDHMTAEVVTTWYRAPELLFGARYYSTGVDMWAVGCIFAQIVLRVPLFAGETNLDQLAKVFNVLGTPTPKDWPDVDLLPNYIEFDVRTAVNLQPLFSATDGKAQLALLLKMLQLNPNKRLTAAEALKEAYFTEELPRPTQPLDLPTPADFNKKDVRLKKNGSFLNMNTVPSSVGGGSCSSSSSSSVDTGVEISISSSSINIGREPELKKQKR